MIDKSQSISLEDIKPALCCFSAEFIEEISVKQTLEFGEILSRKIYLYGEDEDDSDTPAVVVHEHADGTVILFYSIEGVESGRFNFASIIDVEGELDHYSLLRFIKENVDKIDPEQFHLECLENGAVRGELDPKQIN